MRDAALRIADELPAEPAAADLREQEVEEARELLRWLADDHFTFLGYREYQLAEDGRRACAAVPGTGLGILRSDPHHADDDGHPVSPSFDRLPADARAKAREHKLLVLTKANSRATVHRPVLPRLRRREEVRRRRATSSASAASSGCSPPPPTPSRCAGSRSSAARSTRCWRAPGSRPTATTAATCSRSWRPTRATSCSRPRSTSCGPSSPRVLHLQERRRLRLFLRQDEYGRYYSASSTCRATATPPASGCGSSTSCKEELGGTSVDFTAWNTESILSRLHFVVRVQQGTELPRADRRRHGAHRGPAGRGRPLLGRRLRRGADRRARRGARRRAAAPLRQRLPRGLQGRPHRRAPPSPTSSAWSGWPASDEDFALSLYEPVGAAPGRAPLQDLPHRRADLAVRACCRCSAAGRRGRRRAAVRAALRATARSAWIYDFGLRMPAADGTADYLGDDARERFQDAFAALWTGEAENDGFNALVLGAGLTWRQADGAAGVRQVPAPGRLHLQPGLHGGHPPQQRPHHPAAGLACSRPGCRPDRQRAGHELVRRAAGGARRAPSTRWPRWTRTGSCAPSSTVIKATLRTNYFQRGRRGGKPHDYVSMKFDPQAIPRPAGARARRSRSGCTRRGSRACTCASARSPAAACAGPTGARTSAPRSSAWSRRRW